MQWITPQQLQQLLTDEPTVQLVDVRTQEEYHHLGHIAQAKLLPLHELPNRWQELNPTAKTVLVCQHGVRSTDACYYLNHLGFQNLYNVAGGMADWRGSLEYTPPESFSPPA